MPISDRVAIVGLAGRFPGSGADLEAFWRNVSAARDCGREVPPGRWTLPPERALHTEMPHPDAVPTSRGYYLDPFEPDLTDLNIAADLVRELDPLFHLVLDVGGRAFRTVNTALLDRGRAGVILGNICLPTEKSNELARQILGPRIGLKGEASAHPLNRFATGLPAGLLAQALGFGGAAFTLDAACASSLYAIKLAADELLAGRADLMLAGGASRPDCQYTQMGFAQLRALSPRGICSPFGAAADGLVVGEGAGIFVLKRLSDALHSGDPIYATLAGAGLSNDLHGNLLAPAKEGQLRAMWAAYRNAGWRPADVDLIECHATGTPVGDAIEFESLRELWAEEQFTPGQCPIGSVKSTVGHLLTGAGAAAVAKVLLAMRHGIKPPQANFDSANPALVYDASPFRVLSEPADWQRRGDAIPRRAAVSGFGFGGINAHLLLEEWREGSQADSVPPSRSAEPIAIVGIGARAGSLTDAREFAEFMLGGGRAAMPAPRADAADRVPGYFIDEVPVPAARFRIPPREIEAMLPQQALMLGTAAAALDDCQSPDSPELCERTAVFVGLGLDLNATNFHVRWAGLADGVAAAKLPEPLTADRVMGALGSIAASRIARAFSFGGPSFTCCSEETSSGRAVELAVRALRAGEVDRAVAGGVELTGDERTLAAWGSLKPMTPDGEPLALGEHAGGFAPADGAAALVLKRLSDAERDGDRIYAVIAEVGSATGSDSTESGPNADAFARSLRRLNAEPARIGMYEAAAAGVPREDLAECQALAEWLGASPRSMPLAVSASRSLIGHAGFAAAALGIAKAAAALYQQILPPAAEVGEENAELTAVADRLDLGVLPRFWLADRLELPRRAIAAASGSDGTTCHVLLEEYSAAQPHAASAGERAQPLGARSEGLFVLTGDTTAELIDGAARLLAWLPEGESGIEALARNWHARVPADQGRKLALAMAARTVAELREQLEVARSHLVDRPDAPLPDPARPDARGSLRDRLFFSPFPFGPGGKLAFVFPGSGNHFAGMGRELGVQWPGVLRRQQAESELLRRQYAPHFFWTDEIPAAATPRDFLFGQVTFGTLAADLITSLGLQPRVMLGLSLGESAGLFGIRAWTSRDEMFRRLQASTLFTSDLGPPYNAARTALGLKADEPFEWQTGIIAAAADEVREHLRPDRNAFLLIVTGENECVIGGAADDVETLAAAVGRPFLKVSGVTLAHCELGRPVADRYRDLHALPVEPGPAAVFSGAWGRAYDPSEESCAESITAGLLNMIDVPRLIEAAYREGVRAFVEVGPGSSSARMISAILRSRPHVARSMASPRQDAVSQVLRLVAQLAAERFPVSLDALYGGPSACVGHRPVPAAVPKIVLKTSMLAMATDEPIVVEQRPPAAVLAAPPPVAAAPQSLNIQPFVEATARTMTAAAEAHARFLAVQAGLTQTALAAVQLQTNLLARLQGNPMPTRSVEPAPRSGPPRSLSFEQCMAFAVGRIGDVLGPEFVAVDAFPTRVRLPDGPLMLVDRILEIDGVPRSLSRGRVVTEHTVRPDRWYLDAGRCPTSITVESGQADLFLSGFLGIDFETRGRAVYRLLDAEVTFHRGLPKVGDTIRYDIHIDGFFRQADAWLFCFRFEGTIGGQPMLSMKNGVAGFFTAAALAAGQGIVHTPLDRQPMPGKRRGFEPLTSMTACSLDEAGVDALRRGDQAAAFGPEFEPTRRLGEAMKLPGGMLKLVDRAPLIDPAGGRFGLGFIRAEYDLRPKEWFIECHFVDDRVMPGTLMYECCLHTLRILLHRMGWVACEGTVCEPVPGVASRLKCRGQVVESTKRVTYEVCVKELGYGPEPYAIADALMYADGKPIVEILNMSLRMNCTKDDVAAVWSVSREQPVAAAAEPMPNQLRTYSSEQILAFSNGKPSEAFGEQYRVFDEDRVIARLPGPPYQFLDRITEVAGEPFVLKAGAACTAEYDVPTDAWYFAANRASLMPFSVLLEIALQPCGWLAAYCGSALTSPVDLCFRNLGGQAVQHRPVTPDSGRLTTRVKMTKVSSSAGMIIQHYDMAMADREGSVYEGTTYFGFFTREALRNQIGIVGAAVPFLTVEQQALADQGTLPTDEPFPEPMLRMVDVIDGWLPHGGRSGLGLVQGRIAVDPEAWFFKAHFFQDPVWPGSLGLESFLQLLKYAAWRKWAAPPKRGWQTVALHSPHEWVYRGQVLPTDREVTVVLEVTNEDRAARRLTAEGFLCVDGRIIYQMKDFTLE